MSSPNPLVLPVTAATLPAGSCPTTLQDMLNLFSQFQSVTFPDTFKGVIVSATKPGVSDQDKLWQQTDANGNPTRIYSYAGGLWLSRHPMPPGSIILWTGALPDFTSFDGGSTGALGVASGPMWYQATLDGTAPSPWGTGVLIAAQFPIAAGTLPSTAVVAVGATGGEENHVLSASEAKLLAHYHNEGLAVDPATVCYYENDGAPPSPVNSPTQHVTMATGSISSPRTSTVGDATANQAHTNMPPWAGVYLLMRSTKLYYSVS